MGRGAQPHAKTENTNFCKEQNLEQPECPSTGDWLNNDDTPLRGSCNELMRKLLPSGQEARASSSPSANPSELSRNLSSPRCLHCCHRGPAQPGLLLDDSSSPLTGLPASVLVSHGSQINLIRSQILNQIGSLPGQNPPVALVSFRGKAEVLERWPQGPAELPSPTSPVAHLPTLLQPRGPPCSSPWAHFPGRASAWQFPLPGMFYPRNLQGSLPQLLPVLLRMTPFQCSLPKPP